MSANTMSHKWQFKTVWYIVIFFVVVEALNLFTGRVINQYSILPRVLESLPFIFTAPFLHADINHFASNIFTLAVFSYLVMQFGKIQFIKVSISVIIITGALVWIFARPAYHLGASGVIYGYFGFLILAGWLSKQIKFILISVAVAFFYGTMVWGVLPNAPFVSWESHLFGFFSGLIVAWKIKPEPNH